MKLSDDLIAWLSSIYIIWNEIEADKKISLWIRLLSQISSSQMKWLKRHSKIKSERQAHWTRNPTLTAIQHSMKRLVYQGSVNYTCLHKAYQILRSCRMSQKFSDRLQTTITNTLSQIIIINWKSVHNSTSWKLRTELFHFVKQTPTTTTRWCNRIRPAQLRRNQTPSRPPTRPSLKPSHNRMARQVN